MLIGVSPEADEDLRLTGRRWSLRSVFMDRPVPAANLLPLLDQLAAVRVVAAGLNLLLSGSLRG